MISVSAGCDKTGEVLKRAFQDFVFSRTIHCSEVENVLLFKFIFTLPIGIFDIYLSWYCVSFFEKIKKINRAGEHSFHSFSPLKTSNGAVPSIDTTLVWH